MFTHCPYCHCDFGKTPRRPDKEGFQRCPECRAVVEDGMNINDLPASYWDWDDGPTDPEERNRALQEG